MINSKLAKNSFIDFKNKTQEIMKLSSLTLIGLSSCLISSNAMAGNLNSKENFVGKINYTVTGGTLRSNSDYVDACSLNNTSSASLSNIPSGATIKKAYLYWSGSGTNVDNQVTFDGSSLTADTTYTDSITIPDPSYGNLHYDYFQGVKDVTNIVSAKGNGSYQFSNLTVDNSAAYCNSQGVLSGWSLIVIYDDPTLDSNKINTIKLYDGLEASHNQTVNYTLNGIKVATNPIAKFSMLVWEGDLSLGGANESFAFNSNTLTDSFNPLENQFNSSINSNSVFDIYGVDFDTFDVSSHVTPGDNSITGTISTGDDLVLQGAAIMMVTTVYYVD